MFLDLVSSLKPISRYHLMNAELEKIGLIEMVLKLSSEICKPKNWLYFSSEQLNKFNIYFRYLFA